MFGWKRKPRNAVAVDPDLLANIERARSIERKVVNAIECACAARQRFVAVESEEGVYDSEFMNIVCDVANRDPHVTGISPYSVFGTYYFAPVPGVILTLNYGMDTKGGE